MNIPSKQFEIFCGTGGVGKTTLATSRAIYLAQQGKKILLITIDPAKRLKQVLNLNDASAGAPETVEMKVNEQTISFKALLMSPPTTLKRIIEECKTPAALENRIIKTLGRPYGGMNEILALVELYYYSTKSEFDCIVLDTPPGNHFIDFLESCSKINSFFDKSFIEIFNYVARKTFDQAKGKDGILRVMVSSGIKKLLSQLEKVTGGAFVQEFVEAIGLIYELKDSFVTSLKLQEKLKMQGNSNWFLVTSVDHSKLSEALGLKNQASSLMHSDNYILLNKCLVDGIPEIEPNQPTEPAKRVAWAMLNREKQLKEKACEFFEKVLFFPDINNPRPEKNLVYLLPSWSK